MASELIIAHAVVNLVIAIKYIHYALIVLWTTTNNFLNKSSVTPQLDPAGCWRPRFHRSKVSKIELWSKAKETGPDREHMWSPCFVSTGMWMKKNWLRLLKDLWRRLVLKNMTDTIKIFQWLVGKGGAAAWFHQHRTDAKGHRLVLNHCTWIDCRVLGHIHNLCIEKVTSVVM